MASLDCFCCVAQVHRLKRAIQPLDKHVLVEEPAQCRRHRTQRILVNRDIWIIDLDGPISLNTNRGQKHLGSWASCISQLASLPDWDKSPSDRIISTNSPHSSNDNEIHTQNTNSDEVSISMLPYSSLDCGCCPKWSSGREWPSLRKRQGLDHAGCVDDRWVLDSLGSESGVAVDVV